jgi:pumilio RNA-binding family
MQKLIESGREDQKDYIISKLERMSPQIERDVFGNYVVQKVFEKCTDPQRMRMFNKLKGYLVDLSKNSYGCRVV